MSRCGWIEERSRGPLGLFLALVMCALFAATPAHGQRQPPTPEEVQALTLAVESDPNRAGNYVDRGWAYAQLGEEARARADYEKALALKPKSPVALRDFGWALFELRHPAEALVEWKESAAGQETYAWTEEDLKWTTYTSAMAYWVMGQKEQAFAFYTQAAQRMPKKFGSRHALLRYTDFWTAYQRSVIVQLFDAWAAQAKK
jgi:tetratricopeptide (TPR) repeat protein